jgi:hypothetical protein
VLTAEQARELEAKHQLEVLTPRAKSGTMESSEPIRISMQFFGQPMCKIEDADSMYSEWGQLSSREQAGNIKH